MHQSLHFDLYYLFSFLLFVKVTSKGLVLFSSNFDCHSSLSFKMQIMK